MVLIVFLIFIFMEGLWAIDIGVTGMSMKNGKVVTLFGTRNPDAQYHIGLTLCKMSFWIIIILCILVLV